MRIARCEISLGNFRSALNYIDQGLTHDPKNRSLKLEKAKLGRVQKAIEDVKQLITSKKYVEALGMLGCDDLKGCHFAQLCNLQVFFFTIIPFPPSFPLFLPSFPFLYPLFYLLFYLLRRDA